MTHHGADLHLGLDRRLNTHVSTNMRGLVANRGWLHVIQLADLAAGDIRVCR
ncbi:hypothetical protein FHX75_14346 [Micromonospora palomenae]|uniref:Uncharacterized protein n=1 Tax=Micromonospora palomenae TaxID=1461247 RepID=A0A561VK59_9ACTN|nr:hypothetical protein FHX75_14346 [Micromonospora palomenae]